MLVIVNGVVPDKIVHPPILINIYITCMFIRLVETSVNLCRLWWYWADVQADLSSLAKVISCISIPISNKKNLKQSIKDAAHAFKHDLEEADAVQYI